MYKKGYIKNDYHPNLRFLNKELLFHKSDYIPDLWIENSMGDRGYMTEDIIFTDNIQRDNAIRNILNDL